MEKFATIDKARRLLAAEMYTGVIVALAIVLLYENEILLPGSFSDCVNGEFITVSAMEVLTICMLPLALRLFKFKKVSAALASGRERALLRWGGLRMAMLCVPMTANTLLYYLFGLNVAFGYMGMICLLCLVFIYPSTARCTAETNDKE